MSSSNILNKSGLIPSSFASGAGGGGGGGNLTLVQSVANSGITVANGGGPTVGLSTSFMTFPSACQAYSTTVATSTNNTNNFFFVWSGFNYTTGTADFTLGTGNTVINILTPGTYLITYSANVINGGSADTGYLVLYNSTGTINTGTPLFSNHASNTNIAISSTAIITVSTSASIRLQLGTMGDGSIYSSYVDATATNSALLSIEKIED